jgi:ferredoxin
MKIRVNGSACVGQGMCALCAPQLFKLSEEDGKSIVIREEVPAELEDQARQAAQNCPEQAIEILE